jgi:hypothetical protein
LAEALPSLGGFSIHVNQVIAAATSAKPLKGIIRISVRAAQRQKYLSLSKQRSMRILAPPKVDETQEG